MRSKVTVVLLFLNVVLFFYIFKFEEQWRAERANLEAKRRVLPPEIASLDSFTRTTPAGETVRLEKRGDSWSLVRPYEWPANRNAVSRIHDELQFLEHETSFAVADLAQSGQTLADYGLEQPALKLELGAAGETFTLLIGDNTRTGNRLYALTPDTGRIHVVNRSLADSVGLPVAELRADSLFTIPVFEVRSLNIQTGPPANLKVRLRRDSSGRWGFETPILARATKAQIEATINQLSQLTAKSFPEPAPAPDRTGLDSPSLRVTFEGNARRETLLLGQPADDGAVYARFEDKSVVFTTVVDPQLLETLRSSQDRLRDPHVLDFEPATVTSITVTAPGQPTVSLQRLETTAGGSGPDDGPAWQVVTRVTGQAPVTIPGDSAVIQQLIDQLRNVTVREETLPDGRVVRKFVSDAPSASDVEDYGFNQPEREISLGLSTGGGLSGSEPSTQVLQVGVSPDRPGIAFARLASAPFVYEIVPDILDATPLAARHYRQRLLRELPEGAVVTGISLVDLTTGQAVFERRLAEGQKNWDALVAAEPEATRAALKSLATELDELRAARFTAESFSAERAETAEGPRLWRWRLDYTVVFPGAAEAPASLFLTERLGGSTLVAGTADFGGVTFAVTQPLLDAIFTLTYTTRHDPGPANPPVENAASPAPKTP